MRTPGLPQIIARSAAAILLLLGAPAVAQVIPNLPAPAKGKVSAGLLELAVPPTSARQPAGAAVVSGASAGLLRQTGPVVRSGYVLVEAVSVAADGKQLLADLRARGLRGGAVAGARVSGRMPVSALPALQNLPSLRQLRPGTEARTRVGSVTSQGDQAQRSDIARNQFGLSGQGVKVGILSDSYDRLGTAANGVATGDLPPDVEVVAESERPAPDNTDEGRGMAEIVHDVAPGAGIAFATANGGEAVFAQNIRRLRDAGCDIIVDDIIYLAEPFFENGVVAQAVNEVSRGGTVYFSAAGNNAQQSYEAPFRPSGRLLGGGEAHAFGPNAATQNITIAPGGTFSPILQWDDPFFSANGVRGAATDLDLYILFNNAVVASSTGDNLGGDPVEGIVGLTNITSDPLTVQVVIVRFAGPNPGRVKYVNFGDRPLGVQFDTQSSTLVGHANTTEAIAVAAAAYFNTPPFNPSLSTAVVENFSALGGTPLLFGRGGRRLAQPRVLLKPDLTGPDRGNTTFFGGFDPEGDGFPNFAGTSAAAPHVAAVAALQIEASGLRLPPFAYRSLLTGTALDMDNPLTPGFDTGFDFKTGFGFVQADAAIRPFVQASQAQSKHGLLFSVFPNPSRGSRITFEVTARAGQTIRLSVRDMMGKEVFTQTGTKSLALTPDLSALPKGLYVAKVQTDAEVITRHLQLD